MFKRFCIMMCLFGFVLGCVACAAPTPVPTATLLPSPTAQPTDTATPVPTATATATSVPTDTPTPTLTPRPTNTPRPTLTPTPSTDTYVLFTDDFSGSNCILPTASDANHAQGCEGGEFFILNKAAGKMWSAWYPATLDDFILEFDAGIVSGAGNAEYGAWIRQNGNTAYLMSLYSLGGYGASLPVGNEWQDLLAPAPSDAVKKGNEKNHIKIVAQGNQVAFFVNDQFLDSFVDDKSASGKIGFFMGSSQPDVKVVFDNLSVSKINVPQAIPEPRAKTPTPIPPPTLPPDMGGLIVYNWMGSEMNYTIGGKLYKVPGNGHTIILLAPGKYTYSFDAPGIRANCSTAEGCTITIQAGKYETQSWSLQR